MVSRPAPRAHAIPCCLLSSGLAYLTGSMTNATAFSPAPVASRTVDPPSATASGALDLPAATAPLARGDHLGVIDDILTGSSTEGIDEREPEAEDLNALHRRPLRWDGLPPVGPLRARKRLVVANGTSEQPDIVMTMAGV